jgi:hypothetical protein
VSLNVVYAWNNFVSQTMKKTLLVETWDMFVTYSVHLHALHKYLPCIVDTKNYTPLRSVSSYKTIFCFGMCLMKSLITTLDSYLLFLPHCNTPKQCLPFLEVMMIAVLSDFLNRLMLQQTLSFSETPAPENISRYSATEMSFDINHVSYLHFNNCSLLISWSSWHRAAAHWLVFISRPKRPQWIFSVTSRQGETVVTVDDSVIAALLVAAVSLSLCRSNILTEVFVVILSQSRQSLVYLKVYRDHFHFFPN